MGRKWLQVIFVILIPEIIIFTVIALWKSDKVKHPFNNKAIKISVAPHIPVDHSKFPQLQKNFKTPQEVTKACLQCHNNIDVQMMVNEHWTWIKQDSIPGRGKVMIGKKNILNNFCIGIGGNEKLCSMCHAGYGFNTKNFDTKNPENMDCLICHDQTGTYHKSNPCKNKDHKGGWGYPAKGVNLEYVAQHVGLPKRQNCGACHFYGGGGNNVKHGDLEAALIHPTKEIDVHMAANGLNMTCTDCHKTYNHNIPGDLPTVSSSPKNSFSCTECHTSHPHKSKLLNEHTQFVSCEACHIPYYAKGAPTKLYWNWQGAGKLVNGKPIHFEKEIPKDSIPRYVKDPKVAKQIMAVVTTDSVIYEYDSKHGPAILAKDVKPEYCWWNGYSNHVFITDKINPKKVVNINSLMGSYEDFLHPMDKKHPSKIYPVKIMRGRQPYDAGYKTLVNPKLVGPYGGYWFTFNWDSAITAGMKYVGRPFSGKVGFVETRTYWPLHHEVAPKSEALSCTACHSRNSRLSGLHDVYITGYTHNKAIETIGILLVLAAIIGVAGHGILRIILTKKYLNQ